ncbi:MAG: pentapeptide repeat-containing protein [Desulfobacteraceae bacterium]|nr:pentapeptide repeat-containing protein [Desulfobacteraceae bacterium]
MRALFVVILCCLNFFPAFGAFAGEVKRGHSGSITKADMLAIFEKEGTVDGQVINGDDLIDIIRETDFPIKIENSIIEKGLDFEKGGANSQGLPLKPVTEDILPKKWSEEQREKFLQTHPKIRLVENKIEIRNSEIQSYSREKDWGQFQVSIFAENAFFYKDISFYSATFSGKADFDSATFSGDADFYSATFSGDADFYSATFNGKASFNLATFSDYAYFRSATFSYAYFDSATFSGGADFSSATFNDKVSFSSATFNGKASFSSFFFLTTFNGKADFSSATFNSKVSFSSFFSSAIFSGDADFNSATFSGKAPFNSATFSGKADFNSATFSDEADFSSATFSGKADFNSATFSGKADFNSATFSGKADFNSATFSDEADFSSATFSGKADFNSATFTKSALFKNSVFTASLNISSSKFQEYADFRETYIRMLNFKPESPKIVKSVTDFRGAKISEAHFQNIIFENDVDFSDVEFGANYETFRNFIGPPRSEELFRRDKNFTTVFRSLTFKSNADFIRTKFSCDTAFEMVKFREEANFKHARFKEKGKDNNPKFWFSYIDFKYFLIKWNQLPDVENIVKTSEDKIKSFLDIEEEERKKRDQPKEEGKKKKQAQSKAEEKAKPKPDQLENLSEFFQDLEANFRSKNQLKDANEALFQTKIFDLKAARNKADIRERITKELEWIFWGIPCGYATKIWRAVLAFVIIHLLFTLIYYVKGDLFHITGEDGTDLKEKSIFEFPSHYVLKEPPSETPYEKWKKVEMAHRFSMAFLFKFVKGIGIVKITSPCKYFVWAEWIIGFYLWFCFIITSSNTFPMINRLIEGAF